MGANRRMSDTVTFARRYQGFADGALGGYAAGVAAQRIEGPAKQTCGRSPLERELSLQGDGDRVVLRDDETVVLEVTASDFELEIPAPPTLKEAEAASRDLVHDHHPWPGCFTCGPGRAAGDGLRLFMGRRRCC
jgi:hypothetical protein